MSQNMSQTVINRTMPCVLAGSSPPIRTKEETQCLCGFPLFLRSGAGLSGFSIVKTERDEYKNNNKNTCHMSQDMSRKKAGNCPRPFVLC